MPNKFFDIVPPKKKESVDSDLNLEELDFKAEDEISSEEEIEIKVKTPPVLEKAEPIEKIERKEKKPRSRRLFLKSIFFVIICLIIIGIAGYVIFAKTQLEVWPKTEILNLKDTITVNSNVSQADFSAKIMPGKIFDDQRSFTSNFPASGKTTKEGKATGVIKVYNAYSESSQTLVVNTRFVSTDGKLFKSTESKTIPGATYDNKGKLVPSSIDINIQAAEAGEEYNIGPSTFSIPGFAGTPKYTAFYGKSSDPMKGGFKGEIDQVTKADIEKAKNELTLKIKQESSNFLKNSVPKDFTLLEETISQEIIKESSSVQAGTAANSFDYQMELKSQGLSFKKADIEGFIKNLIVANLPKEKKYQQESLKIDFSLKSKEPSRAVLELEINVKVYSELNLGEIKKAIAGKSIQEVKIFLTDQSQITKIEIKNSPFWRKRIPKNINNLDIILNLGPI